MARLPYNWFDGPVEWLLQKATEASDLGELAKDVAMDATFPRQATTKAEIETHIRNYCINEYGMTDIPARVQAAIDLAVQTYIDEQTP